MPDCALSLDIGGSHVSAALVDIDKRQVIKTSLARRSYSHEAASRVLIEAWAETALKALGQQSASLSHIGLAMPAPFDYERGISLLEHKFASLYQCNIRSELEKAWQSGVLAGLALRFANDADLFALGEWWAGAAQASQAMIGITLGTGLGAGFVEKGKILRRDERIPEDGEIWNLPYLAGIAEDYVSATALTKSYTKRLHQRLSAKQIADLARSGDETARSVFWQMAEHLAAILEPLVYSFKPQSIVLGGNLAKAWDLFREPLVLAFPDLTIQPSQHFEQAALLGAAALGSADKNQI